MTCLCIHVQVLGVFILSEPNRSANHDLYAPILLPYTHALSLSLSLSLLSHYLLWLTASLFSISFFLFIVWKEAFFSCRLFFFFFQPKTLILLSGSQTLTAGKYFLSHSSYSLVNLDTGSGFVYKLFPDVVAFYACIICIVLIAALANRSSSARRFLYRRIWVRRTEERGEGWGGGGEVGVGVGTNIW